MTLKEAREMLCEAGIESYDHDARELFIRIGGCKPPVTSATECDSEELRLAVERRRGREPLQYIIGEVGFYRESYEVSPSCLIPRSDTEILVDFATKELGPTAYFADLCCGSGCIGISTLCNTKDTRAIAVDISAEALALTERNAKRNGVADRIDTVRCDLLSDIGSLKRYGPFAAILSNPPYVKSSVYPTLDKEIFFEPKIAFLGGEDGADLYRVITEAADGLLCPDGFIAFEIGYDQGWLLSDIAKEHGYTCDIKKDYSGNDRVAVLRKAK